MARTVPRRRLWNHVSMMVPPDGFRMRSQGAQWPGVVPLLGAACLLAIVWTASVLVAARRERGSPLDHERSACV